MRSPFARFLLSGFMIAPMLAACDLAPDFKLPEVSKPAAFKEAPEKEGSFKKGEPKPEADKGEWWKIFGDEKLNGLMQQAIEANQDIKAADARLQQARAVADVSKADLFPRLDAGANVARFYQPAATYGFAIPPRTVYTVNGQLSYEADVFGRLRGARRASVNDALAQEGVARNVLLVVQAEVAQNYFAVRALDTEHTLLQSSVVLREEAERIFKIRFDEGLVSDTDYARAQAELATTRAAVAQVAQQRANFEHALAVLIGKTPAEFSMQPTPLENDPPMIPAGLPSRLLERRPDIASAEAQLAASNARIGIARAAFFPLLNLTANGGFQSNELGDLFQWSSRSWALGPLNGTALTLPVFDFGRNSANLTRSKAAYEESVATYRQQVLVAFREVEDNLSAQKFLREQVAQQKIAADASTRASKLSRMRFDEGDYSYLEVVDADRSELTAKRAYAQAQGATYAATIDLIRALGGGWDGEVLQAPTPINPPVPAEKTPEVTAPAAEAKPAVNAETAIAQPAMAPEPAIIAEPTVNPEAQAGRITFADPSAESAKIQDMKQAQPSDQFLKLPDAEAPKP